MTLAQQGYEGIKQYSPDEKYAADTIRRFGTAPEGVIQSETEAISPGPNGLSVSNEDTEKEVFDFDELYNSAPGGGSE